MKIKDIIKCFFGEPEEAKKKPQAKAEPKAAPKAAPKVDYIDEEVPGLIQINEYKRPFKITGTGILFPDGSVQTTAQGGAVGIDPDLIKQVEQNTSDIAKNQGDISTNALDIQVEKIRNNEQDGKIAANEADIATNKDDIATNKADIATNKADIKTNKNNIQTNKDNIASNKSAITGLQVSLAATNNNVIELEEEIEALAPSFDRGHWAHDPDTTYGRPPLDKHYYIASGVVHADKFKDVTEIFFSNNDSDDPSHTHTFSDVEAGQMIEVFEGADSSFMLAEVTKKTANGTYTVFEVNVIKAEGGPGIEEESENPDVSNVGAPGVIRVKFFTMAATDIDLDSYATKKYVDAQNRILTSGYNNSVIKWVSPQSLNIDEFASAVSAATTSKYYMKYGYDYNESQQYVKDYQRSEGAILEVYLNSNPPSLIVKASIKQITTSQYRDIDAQVSVGVIWAKPGYSYDTSKRYFWIMTGVNKQIGN